MQADPSEQVVQVQFKVGFRQRLHKVEMTAVAVHPHTSDYLRSQVQCHHTRTPPFNQVWYTTPVQIAIDQVCCVQLRSGVQSGQRMQLMLVPHRLVDQPTHCCSCLSRKVQQARGSCLLKRSDRVLASRLGPRQPGYQHTPHTTASTQQCTGAAPCLPAWCTSLAVCCAQRWHVKAAVLVQSWHQHYWGPSH